mmetsp:Transcript_39136/g.113067  ORF Transcript_39136/g.113067 Transcript_39136/m.113067 type:complete len:193 (+) Transcript_39136:2290-2868(+)
MRRGAEAPGDRYAGTGKLRDHLSKGRAFAAHLVHISIPELLERNTNAHVVVPNMGTAPSKPQDCRMPGRCERRRCGTGTSSSKLADSIGAMPPKWSARSWRRPASGQGHTGGSRGGGKGNDKAAAANGGSSYEAEGWPYCPSKSASTANMWRSGCSNHARLRPVRNNSERRNRFNRRRCHASHSRCDNGSRR